jgi:hypothetical protein
LNKNCWVQRKMSEIVFTGKHIIVKLLHPSTSGRTNIYQIVNESGDILGRIQWYGPWRQYCHVIHNELFGDSFNDKLDYLVFAPSCENDIAECCLMLTKEHRKKSCNKTNTEVSKNV